jgi:hypothetical protein
LRTTVQPTALPRSCSPLRPRALDGVGRSAAQPWVAVPPVALVALHVRVDLEPNQFTLIYLSNPKSRGLTLKMGKVDKVALLQENSCLMTFHSWQSLTNYTKALFLTRKRAKEQDGARKHAVKATFKRIEGFDDRCATAKPNRKDHNEFEGLQM